MRFEQFRIGVADWLRLIDPGIIDQPVKPAQLFAMGDDLVPVNHIRHVEPPEARATTEACGKLQALLLAHIAELPLLYTLQVAFAAEAWRRRHGARMRTWINIAAEMEAEAASLDTATQDASRTKRIKAGTRRLGNRPAGGGTSGTE